MTSHNLEKIECGQHSSYLGYWMLKLEVHKNQTIPQVINSCTKPKINFVRVNSGNLVLTLSQDVVSWSDITPCNKIDLQISNVTTMTSIFMLHNLR